VIRSSFFSIHRQVHSFFANMSPGSLIKKRTQKESNKNKKPTKKARKTLQSDSLEEEDLYAAPVRRNQEERNQEDNDDEADLEDDKNEKDDDSEDEEESDEENKDEENDGMNSAASSAASLILEKEQVTDRRKPREKAKSETTNRETAASMFLEDAPLQELSTTIKTLMKDVVDNTLFKQVKFYRSPQELNHVMGYVFYRIGQNGKGVHDRLERTRLWAARCEYISTQTCELRQHLYDRWYAIGYGKFKFLFFIFQEASTYKCFYFIAIT